MQLQAFSALNNQSLEVCHPQLPPDLYQPLAVLATQYHNQSIAITQIIINESSYSYSYFTIT